MTFSIDQNIQLCPDFACTLIQANKPMCTFSEIKKNNNKIKKAKFSVCRSCNTLLGCLLDANIRGKFVIRGGTEAC